MADEPTASDAADADPGSLRGGVGTSDPLFQKQEPVEHTPRRVVLLWQFFLFPLLIVGAAVGVFVFFGAIAGSGKDPDAWLKQLRSGGENAKQQAAYELAQQVARERERVDADAREGGEGAPPFYADPEFLGGLRSAYADALADGTDDRRRALAVMIGLTRDVSGLPLLERTLYPEGDQAAFSESVRIGAAEGVGWMGTPPTLPVVVRMAGDDDAQVRALAIVALSRLVDPESLGIAARTRERVAGDPRILDTLRGALEDTDVGVRLNAAVGLALLGDDAGAGTLAKSLDPVAMAEMEIPSDIQRRLFMVNAIKGARILGTEALRAQVERLTDAEVEKDDVVRQKARAALERWRTS